MEYFSLKTFHGTQIFIDDKGRVSHKIVGRGSEVPLFAERIDDGIHIFFERKNERRYITEINSDMTLETGTEPSLISSIVNADGSITLKVGNKYLSARKNGAFALAPKNLGWEHLALIKPKTIEKRKAILLMMNKRELNSVLSTFDLDKIKFLAVLMEGAGNKTVNINGDKVPVMSLQLLDRVLSIGKECLWLLGGWPPHGGVDMTGITKCLTDEGVPRENIINCVILQNITRRWYGNIHYAEKQPIDFFSTGISCAEVALDLERIDGARGVILANSSQDLRQGYLTARHVFEYRSSPPPS